MEDFIQFFVEQGLPLAYAVYGAILAWLFLAGMGAPLPEDVVMIAAAVLVQQGVIELWPTLLTLTIGVIIGDSTLFFIARWFGKKIYKWTLVRRVLTDKRRLWLEERIERHGGRAVFVARHIAPIRGATFALAAIHGLSYARFIAWDVAALMFSLPIWMGLGWFFADTLEELSQHTWALVAAVVGIVAFFVIGHFVFTWLKKRVQRQVDEEIEASSEGPGLVMTDGDESLNQFLTEQATGRTQVRASDTMPSPDAPRQDQLRSESLRPDGVRPDTLRPDTLRPDGVRREALRPADASRTVGPTQPDPRTTDSSLAG